MGLGNMSLRPSHFLLPTFPCSTSLGSHCATPCACLIPLPLVLHPVDCLGWQALPSLRETPAAKTFKASSQGCSATSKACCQSCGPTHLPGRSCPLDSPPRWQCLLAARARVVAARGAASAPAALAASRRPRAPHRSLLRHRTARRLLPAASTARLTGLCGPWLLAPPHL